MVSALGYALTEKGFVFQPRTGLKFAGTLPLLLKLRPRLYSLGHVISIEVFPRDRAVPSGQSQPQGFQTIGEP